MQHAQFQQRLRDFRASMQLAAQDAALIFSLDNLRYLFNYTGEAAYGVVTADALYLITDYRFVEQAEQECNTEYLAANVICRDRDKQSLGVAMAELLHEQPFISPVCREHLGPHYVVTIEPGIYIPGYGGIRIEDDVLITDDGYQLLTHAPKEFELSL